MVWYKYAWQAHGNTIKLKIKHTLLERQPYLILGLVDLQQWQTI
jgi:hypothetical protein